MTTARPRSARERLDGGPLLERPHGRGRGRSTFDIFGTPPGEYVMLVDRKVDAYVPAGVDVPGGRAVLLAGEHHGFVTSADVAIPP